MAGLKTFLLVIPTLFVSLAYSDTFDVEAENYKAHAYFTSVIPGEGPQKTIERGSFKYENVVLNVIWSRLEDRPYQFMMKAFDPSDFLTNEWLYEFRPVNGSYHVYYSFGMGECITVAGLWRFEVYLDGERVLDTHIEVDYQSDT